MVLGAQSTDNQLCNAAVWEPERPEKSVTDKSV